MRRADRQETTRMGGRIARDLCRVHRLVLGVCGACTERAAGRERIRLCVLRDWIRVHGFLGAAGGAETGAGLADWTSASVDARALVAGFAELAGDSVSRRISFWRDADQRLDVA